MVTPVPANIVSNIDVIPIFVILSFILFYIHSICKQKNLSLDFISPNPFDKGKREATAYLPEAFFKFLFSQNFVKVQ